MVFQIFDMIIKCTAINKNNIFSQGDIKMRNYWKILMFIIVYGGLSVLMFWKERDFLYLMLIWNVMLATVPLIMIIQAKKTDKSWMRGAFMLLWILFLPNAFYMITDFIHITNHPMIWVIPVEPYSGQSGMRYTMDPYLWARLLIISLGAFYALLAALESSRVFLDMADPKRRGAKRFLYVFLISLLSSVGIYIGRFLRFNSWDILNPTVLFRSLIGSSDGLSLSFILIYTVFILSTFLVFSLFYSESTPNRTKMSEKIEKDFS